ncbi:molybdate ABC transporter substrate-binding protein [Myxococcaceae bacterium JPH2]|nr:molybdate ABC transporter substrate-binding protein [Myxococcaceae bacterium JPH2]
MRALLLVSLMVLVTLPARAERALVFAAASTQDALQELAPAFTRATGHEVAFSFGGSGDLSRQIVAGAPADAFLSADVAKLESVQKAGLVRAGARVDLLSNRLVVVVPADAKAAAPRSAADLAGLSRVVLADPTSVPAGVYAKAWLEKVGAWRAVEPRVIPALDVRAALAAVEAGRVDAGVVYATDASLSKKVRVAFAVPEADTPAIVYPVAALTGGKGPEAGLAFVRFLQTEPARRVFARLGFVVLGGARKSSP